ncbi:hypothetical protein YC2023_033179 [Brassica napus]
MILDAGPLFSDQRSHVSLVNRLDLVSQRLVCRRQESVDRWSIKTSTDTPLPTSIDSQLRTSIDGFQPGLCASMICPTKILDWRLALPRNPNMIDICQDGITRVLEYAIL